MFHQLETPPIIACTHAHRAGVAVAAVGTAGGGLEHGRHREHPGHAHTRMEL